MKDVNIIINLAINFDEIMKVGKCNISKVGFKTRAGNNVFGGRKTNQDSNLQLVNILDTRMCIFGVFDGHGEQGHRCSGAIKNYLINYFSNSSLYSEDMSLINSSIIYEKLVENKHEKLIYAYHSTENYLQKQKFDSFFSGSTAVIIIILGIKDNKFN